MVGFRVFFLLLFLMPFNLCFGFSSINTLCDSEKFPWVVYYGDRHIENKKLDPYNPIILDRDSYPNLSNLLSQKKEILGYVAIGEIEDHRTDFLWAKSHHLLIEENPDWPGSWSVDVRLVEWKNFLIQELIPKIVQKGFTGLFLDQADVSLELEKKDPKKFKGMSSALIHLVEAIRSHFPHLRIMMNRGFEILPQIGHLIDYELAETLYATYNFKEKRYFIRSFEEVEWALSILNDARRSFPHLVVFSLDYWDPDKTKEIKQIYSQARKCCIRPYVTTVFLDQITPEP